jgi:hypothetical protein
MEVQRILADDVDVLVFGEGCEEFLIRMFRSDFNAFVVNQWNGVKQVTQVVSTEHLFMHFNFFVVGEGLVGEVVDVLKRDIYLGIVTFLLDDSNSFEKCSELYDKFIQDQQVALKSLPGKLGFCQSSIIPEDLNLLTHWHSSDSHQPIQAGLKAALCSERKASIYLNQNRDGVLNNVKFITKSEEKPFIEEKQSIFLWMFENFMRKNKKLGITQDLLSELKDSFETFNTSSCILI